MRVTIERSKGYTWSEGGYIVRWHEDGADGTAIEQSEVFEGTDDNREPFERLCRMLLEHFEGRRPYGRGDQCGVVTVSYDDDPEAA